jgi:EmrB/QacA subfamily drug resistance transporter
MEQKYTTALISLLFVGVLMGALDLAIIGPALPAMQAEFGMDNRQLSVLFNAYVLCQIVGTPLLAKLSDRFGPRAIYIFSIGCFAAGSLLLVMTSQPAWLFVGRGIQGFGAGGIFPVAAAVIGTQLPREKRGPALGLIGVVFGVAFLLGPVLGGVLLQFSWQWLFLINLPIAAVLIGGAIKLLPTANAREPKPFDIGGAITISIALTALVVALNNFDSVALVDSLRSILFLPFLAVSAMSGWLFWRIEKRAADPILRPAFFKSRQITTTCLVALGVGAVQSGSVFYPALAVSALGVTQSEASFLMLPAVIASTIASPIAGRLLNHLGTRNIVFTSLMLVYVSVMIYGLTDLRVVTFIGAGIVSGIGMAGLLGAPLRFSVLNETGARDRGAAQGLLNVFFSIGRLLGAAIVGGVAASHGGGTSGYQVAFVVMGIPAAAMVFVATRLKSKAAEQDVAENDLAAQSA